VRGEHAVPVRARGSKLQPVNARLVHIVEIREPRIVRPALGSKAPRLIPALRPIRGEEALVTTGELDELPFFGRPPEQRKDSDRLFLSLHRDQVKPPLR
jgi:hypothetical protein